MSLAAAQDHQERYYRRDLPMSIKYMEEGVYERLRDYLSLLSRTELLTALVCKSSFGKVKGSI